MKSTNYRNNLTVLFISYLLIEIFSFVVGKYFLTRVIGFQPLESDGYDEYLANRHPTLGWPFLNTLKQQHDSEGSRYNPSFPDPKTAACVSLYGDSFTWGQDVADEFTIGNLLSQNLGCRVSNFGVTAYGTDQSYIRFIENIDDESPIVVLNHFSEDIFRNVNRFHNLLWEENYVKTPLFKPRFIKDGSQIKLIPIPTPSPNELECYLKTPELCLENEYFIPNKNIKLNKFDYPYSISIIKNISNGSFKHYTFPNYTLAYIYRKDDPTDAIFITKRLIELFHQEAKARSKIPIITIVASTKEIENFRKSNKWEYQSLIDELDKIGIKIINLGDKMNIELGSNSPRSIDNYMNHFTKEGYAMMAKPIEIEIKKSLNKPHN
jgi:hypothetical protein